MTGRTHRDPVHTGTDTHAITRAGFPGRMNAWLLPWIFLIACGDPEPRADAAVELTSAWSHCALLLGDWQDHSTDKKYQFHENWTAVNDSLFAGKGCALSGADTVFVEELKLFRRGDQAVYAARITSQNTGQWVEFISRTACADSIVFENPAHDFPRTIAYVPTTDGGWNVSLNGAENGVRRDERLSFVRSPAPTP